jgi:hypothetical protein
MPTRPSENIALRIHLVGNRFPESEPRESDFSLYTAWKGKPRECPDEKYYSNNLVVFDDAGRGLALLAARHAMPTSCGSREYAEIGGLMMAMRVRQARPLAPSFGRNRDTKCRVVQRGPGRLRRRRRLARWNG